MDHEKMGQFIAQLRKANHMTQRELAGKLNITDKAVSKWERGLSCPDITLLGPLAEALGVTTGELLNGEKCGDLMAPAEADVRVDQALEYADKTAKGRVQSLQKLCGILFSVSLLLGAAVCAVCDVAIAGGFTWSWYPIWSIVFGWAVLFPVIRFGAKGVWGSLASLSVLLIPFLYVIGRLVGQVKLMMAIGVPSALIALAYLWIAVVVFKVWRNRMLLVGAVFLLMAVPVELLVNWNVARVLAEPASDRWDILSVVLMGVFGLCLLMVDIWRHKKPSDSR